MVVTGALWGRADVGTAGAGAEAERDEKAEVTGATSEETSGA